jgi:hypothetical protein
MLHSIRNTFLNFEGFKMYLKPQHFTKIKIHNNKFNKPCIAEQGLFSQSEYLNAVSTF